MCAEIVGLCATVYGHDCTPATIDINNNVMGWALENILSKQRTLTDSGSADAVTDRRCIARREPVHQGSTA